MNIPDPWVEEDRYYERLKKAISLSLKVHGREVPFLVEPPAEDFYYAVTPEEMEVVLNLLPPRHVVDLEYFVLRQQKAKELLFESKWGCFRVFSTTGKYMGRSIHLCSQRKVDVIPWAKSLSKCNAEELKRLEGDGHRITSDARKYYIHTSLDSNRNTQLFRTLPHEVGHHVDAMEQYEWPGEDEHEAWELLFDRYYSRPSREREDYAHRYADEFFRRQVELKNLPFPRIMNLERFEGFGIRPEWFQTS
ncbi:MAG: hypothetical protein ACPG31_01140 [Planctomycetota bacterium]